MIVDDAGNKISTSNEKFTVLWGRKSQNTLQSRDFENRDEAINFIKDFLDFDPNHLGIFFEKGEYCRAIKEFSRPDTDKQSPLYAKLD